MKHRHRFASVAILGSLFVVGSLSSCSSDDDSPQDPDEIEQELDEVESELDEVEEEIRENTP